jgi:hypothetical protein
VNILPLVFAFLLIFSCVTFTLLRDLKSYSLIETALRGYARTERALSSKIARRAYEKATREPSPPKKDPKSSNPHYFSRRLLFPPLEQSKLNLTPLIKSEQEWKLHPLYELTVELLRQLYQKPLFNKSKEPEKIAYRLIDEMIKKARKLGKVDNISELSPDDPLLRRTYYKMLRGTNQYDHNQGIPPLGHFFCMHQGKEAIALSFASPPLLEALLGHEIALEILRLEQEKGGRGNDSPSISKEELQSLCLKSPNKIFIIQSLNDYLNDSKNFNPREYVGGRDRITGISVEKRL